MNPKTTPHPHFRDEAEERQFWEKHDSSDYVDWSKAERVRPPNLKPSAPVVMAVPGLGPGISPAISRPAAKPSTV